MPDKGLVGAAIKLKQKAPYKSQIRNAENKLNDWLGKPMLKGAADAEKLGDAGGDDPIDNYRHAMSGYYTSKAIQDKTGNIPFVSKGLAFLGTNLLGAGHEISTIFKDERPWSVKLRESGEDMFNNLVGAATSSTPFVSDEKKKEFIKYLSLNNLLPDGYGEKNANMYFKNNK
jgi:hypothetical protein